MTTETTIDKNRARQRLSSESGVALVEFALVLPLLLIILLGVLDFGKMLNYWHDETQLSNVGARVVAVNKNLGTSLSSYLKSQTDTGELRNGGTSSLPAGMTVTACYTADSSSSATTHPAVGDAVTVKVGTTYHIAGFLAPHLSVTQVGLNSSATMRLEQIPTNYSLASC